VRPRISCVRDELLDQPVLDAPRHRLQGHGHVYRALLARLYGRFDCL
jgi:hypothetical protein